MQRHTSRGLLAATLIILTAMSVTAGCGSDPAGAPSQRVLKISSIPDQDPEKLATRDGAMARYLAKALGVEVEYVPVTDYAASVALFRTGDLDFVSTEG
jgi:phosphonate transport system substrate-binding protein